MHPTHIQAASTQHRSSVEYPRGCRCEQCQAWWAEGYGERLIDRYLDHHETRDAGELATPAGPCDERPTSVDRMECPFCGRDVPVVDDRLAAHVQFRSVPKHSCDGSLLQLHPEVCQRCRYVHSDTLACSFDECACCGGAFAVAASPEPLCATCAEGEREAVTEATNPTGCVVADLAIPTGDTGAVTLGATLRAAVVYLDRHGWVQGHCFLPSATVFTPAADMVGAICMVCYGGPVGAPAQHLDAPEWAAFDAAVTYLDSYLSDRFGLDVYTFNDAPGRSLAEVRQAVLRAAWLHDGRRLTPVCCQRLMVDVPGLPCLVPSDAFGLWTVARVFSCSLCDRVAVRPVAECSTEARATARAAVLRTELAIPVPPEPTRPVAHADYPHKPGLSYDCPACMARCFCDGTGWRCVHCQECGYCNTDAETSTGTTTLGGGA